MGVFLPLLLALGGLMADGHVQPSISDFFHTTQRDLFVGGLVAIGIFLAAHRGFHRHPGRWLSPDLIALVAGLSAIGVAFFPNESDTVTTFTQKELGLSLAPVFHYLSALLLYLMMSLTCFLVFAPASDGWPRRFYLWAGRLIFFTGVMVMVLSAIKNNSDGFLSQLIVDHNLIFWDESLGVWAFCVSWLLEGWLAARTRNLRRQMRATGRNPLETSPAITPPNRPWPGRGLVVSILGRLIEPTRDQKRSHASGLLASGAPQRHGRPTKRKDTTLATARERRRRA